MDILGLSVYLRWLADEGPEMWLLYDRDDGLVGFNPHFHGEARVAAALARAFGGHGEQVERTEDFEPAFERAVASAQ